ncbi:Short integuments 2, mitochondrial [Linum perenne]
MHIAHQPSIHVLDTLGVLIPSIPDIETGLKLALAGLPTQEDKLLIKLNRRIRNASRDKILELNEVDVHAKAQADLQRFCDTTIDRYSRDNLLPLEKQKLSGEVEIDVTKHAREPGIKLPLTALFNSTVKILRLSQVMFDKGANLPLSPTALRFLHLNYVVFEEDGILTNLIASSPHLETLELVCSKNLKKLQFSNVGSLKNLKIEHYQSMEEIEIVAPGLHSLYLETRPEFKFKLTAPQLNLLQISTNIITSAYLDSLLRACRPKHMIVANTFRGFDWHEFFNQR